MISRKYYSLLHIRVNFLHSLLYTFFLIIVQKYKRDNKSTIECHYNISKLEILFSLDGPPPNFVIRYKLFVSYKIIIAMASDSYQRKVKHLFYYEYINPFNGITLKQSLLYSRSFDMDFSQPLLL